MYGDSPGIVGIEFQETLESYSMSSQLTAVCNLRVRIIEQIYLTIADHCRICEFTLDSEEE